MEKNEWSSFEYSPQGEILSFSFCGEVFLYDFKNNKFCINQNPLGEPNPVQIQDVDISKEMDRVSFNTMWKSKIKHIGLHLNNDTDKALCKMFSIFDNTPFKVKEKDYDRIEMSFSQGILQDLGIYKKYSDLRIDCSLTIYKEENNFYLLLRNPCRKHRINSIQINDRSILCKIENNETIEYILDIQTELLIHIKHLIINSIPILS